MTVSTLTMICDIVQEYLELCKDQVWIYNQKRNIPTDSRLYVVVAYSGSTVYAATKRHIGGENVTSEHGQAVQETIEVNLISASPEAVDRAHEVVGALSSDYSISLQELNQFHIAPKPVAIRDTSAAEVTRMLFRTTIEIKVLRAYQQTKNVAYYEQFELERLVN